MIKTLSRLFSNPNPYKVLGISENASKDQIKLAYYRIAKKYHPDINSHYPEYFAAVTQAYKELESHNFKYEATKSNQDSQEEEIIVRPKGRKFKVENDDYKKKKALFEVLFAVTVTVFVLLNGILYASKNHSKKIINEQNELMQLEGLEKEYDEENQVIRFYPK